jgi:23S rRNA pseudoU1915 N3-methylase RlmH
MPGLSQRPPILDRWLGYPTGTLPDPETCQRRIYRDTCTDSVAHQKAVRRRVNDILRNAFGTTPFSIEEAVEAIANAGSVQWQAPYANTQKTLLELQEINQINPISETQWQLPKEYESTRLKPNLGRDMVIAILPDLPQQFTTRDIASRLSQPLRQNKITLILQYLAARGLITRTKKQIKRGYVWEKCDAQN